MPKVSNEPIEMPKETICLSGDNASCLKGKNVGDECNISLKGKVTGINEGYGKDKALRYTVEIVKMHGGCGSKRR
jgi:hypothetical protein